MENLETLDFLIALGTIGMQVLSVLLLALFYFRNKAWAGKFVSFVTERGLLLSLLIVIAGTVLSLIYSEYFGIVPCGLCWLQRVFLYPQLVLFVLAVWWRDHRIADYSIALSFIGGAVALYHHFIQMGGNSVLPCPASGVGDCAKRFLFEFDYITFPLVAFSSFTLLIIIMLFVRMKRDS